MHSDDIATHLMCRSFKDIEPITSDYSDWRPMRAGHVPVHRYLSVSRQLTAGHRLYCCDGMTLTRWAASEITKREKKKRIRTENSKKPKFGDGDGDMILICGFVDYCWSHLWLLCHVSKERKSLRNDDALANTGTCNHWFIEHLFIFLALHWIATFSEKTFQFPHMRQD